MIVNLKCQRGINSILTEKRDNMRNANLLNILVMDAYCLLLGNSFNTDKLFRIIANNIKCFIAKTVNNSFGCSFLYTGNSTRGKINKNFFTTLGNKLFKIFNARQAQKGGGASLRR